jgi:hypothetical protein
MNGDFIEDIMGISMGIEWNFKRKYQRFVVGI